MDRRAPLMPQIKDEYNSEMFAAFEKELEFRLSASTSSQDDPVLSRKYHEFEKYRDGLEVAYLQKGVEYSYALRLTPKRLNSHPALNHATSFTEPIRT